MDNTLKVSSKTNPNSVAGAIVAILKTESHVKVHAVGAGALNQGVKAIAIARGFLAPGGKDLICTPAFLDIQINGEDRTAIQLIVELRER